MTTPVIQFDAEFYTKEIFALVEAALTSEARGAFAALKVTVQLCLDRVSRYGFHVSYQETVNHAFGTCRSEVRDRETQSALLSIERTIVLTLRSFKVKV